MMKCKVLVFVALLQYSTVCGQVSLTANATLDGALCPGSVQFTCVATQQAALRWRFNNTVPNIVESAYTVDSSVPSLATPMPGVTVELVSRENIVNQTFADFTSTLTVDITVLRDDVVRSISCGSPANTTVLDIPMLTVQAPPTAPSFLPLSRSDFTGQDSSLQVTLHWTAPVVYPQPSDAAAVSRYVITSDQAGTCAQGGCVVSLGGPGFSQREYTLGNLPLSQDYTFTVRADNCEMGGSFQTGTASDGLVLSLQLPAMPDCGSVPVYDSNGQLVGIETNWTAVVAPVSEVAPNVSGDVANYVVRIAEVAQSTEVLDPSEVCGVSGCSYRVNNTFAGDSGQYTVILQARNIVGTGLHGECGTIGLMNTIVDVTPRTTDASSPVVQCVFSQLAPGSVASCTVCFGTDRSSLLNCSSSVGSTGEVTVALPRLLATIRYFYRTEASIDGSIVTAVEGTFATECDSADLGGSSDPTLRQRCSSTSAGSVSVPNGVVCYTGTSAGSTATYQCDGSHTVFSAEDTRTCQSDGNWNGAVQTCVFVGLRGWHVALTVLGVVSWVAAAALTVVALVLILCARRPASLFWWHWLYIVLLVVNAVLLLVSAVLWIVFGAVVDNPRGHAAALTDYRDLRDALCAVTFALSLVALLLVIAAVVLVHVIKKSTSTTAKSVEMVEKEFEGAVYPGQQEEDEFRVVAISQKRIEEKKTPSYITKELVPMTREEAAARKKDEKEAVYHTTNHKETESTGATRGGEYSELQHGQGQGKGGSDKGRGQPPSTSKQVNIHPNEYQALNRGAGESRKNAPPPPPPPSEQYDTLETAGLPQTTTTTAAAGGAEYGKLNPQPGDGKPQQVYVDNPSNRKLGHVGKPIGTHIDSKPQPGDGKKGKAGRGGKAHPPPTAEYSQLDTTSRSTESSTAQEGVVEYAQPNTGARYTAQTSQ